MDGAHLFLNPLMLYWARAALWECLKVLPWNWARGAPLPLCNLASAPIGKGLMDTKGRPCPLRHKRT